MTISFSGLASGLDTSSWVESLVALKQAKIDTLEEEKETVLLSKETLDNIKSFFTSFRSMIEKVTDAQFGVASMDLFAQNLATSSNLDVLTASATTDAEEAVYNVQVNELATNSAANSNYCYMTTIVQTTTARSDSKLINLGVKAGRIGVTVDGVERGIELTDNDTIQTFVEKLNAIGVSASYNELTGVFFVDIDKNDINDIDNTGISDAFHFEGVNEGYTSDSLEISSTDTVFSVATEDTLLSALGVKDGVVTIHANDSDYLINITSTTTLGGFIDELQKRNIDIKLDADGILTINDARITDEGTTNIIEALGLNSDIYSNTQISGDLSHKTIITQTTTATSDTLLKDLGDGINITDGQTVIIKNSSNEYTTITVGTTTTLGELLSDMTNAGVYAALNKDGTIEISGGTITGGTFDAISALKLTAEPYTAMTTGKPLTETVQKAELVTLETKLVDDLKVRAGYLEVTDADGNKFYEKIYHGQTLGDLMSDLGNLGIYTKLRDDGVLEITGGAFATLSDDRVQELIDNGTIRETDDRYKQSTDLLTCLYGAPVISTDQITVASTYSKTQALTHSVTNTIRATLTTTLENLGLTSDSNAVFTVRGENRTINVTKSMTVEDLMNALQNAGIASVWDTDTSRLTIENATLNGGALADVLNLTQVVSGKYVSTDELTKKVTVAVAKTTSSSTLLNSTTYIMADYSTMLSQIGIDKSNTLTIHKSDGSTLNTVITNTTTIDGLFDILDQYGIQGVISDGVITLTSADGAYITDASGSNLLAKLGIQTESYVQTITVGTSTTGSSFKFTLTQSATGDNTFAQIGSGGNKTWTIRDGATGAQVASGTFSESTTIGQFLDILGQYGFSGSIDGGFVTVSSPQGYYVTGTAADALGLKTYQYTTTVHGTATNTIAATDTFTVDQTRTVTTSGVVTVNASDTIVVDITRTVNTSSSGYVTVTVSDTITVNVTKTIDTDSTGTTVITNSTVVTMTVRQTLTTTITTTSATTQTQSITTFASKQTTVGSLGLDGSYIVSAADGGGATVVNISSWMTIDDMVTAINKTSYGHVLDYDESTGKFYATHWNNHDYRAGLQSSSASKLRISGTAPDTTNIANGSSSSAFYTTSYTIVALNTTSTISTTSTVSVAVTKTITDTFTVTLDTTGKATINIQQTLTVSATRTEKVDTTGSTVINVKQTLTINATSTERVDTTGTVRITQTVTVTAHQTITVDVTATNTYTANKSSADHNSFSTVQNIDGNTKLYQIGLNNGTINGISNGEAFSVSINAGDTIDGIAAKLAAHGIEVSVNNGALTFKGNKNAYITSATESALKLGAGSAYTTQTESHNFNTNSNEQGYNTTKTITTESTLASMGLGTNGTITVERAGTLYTVTVKNTDTIDDLFTSLAALDIKGSLNNGTLTLSGTDSSFVKDVSTNLNNVLKLKIGEGNSYVTSTYTVKTTLDTKLNQLTDKNGNSLGITSGNIYVYQDGTRYLVNINNEDTLQTLASKLSQYGITMGLDSNGKLYFDGTNNSYMTTQGISSGASNILAKLNIADNWNTRYDSISENLEYTVEVDNRIDGNTKLSELQDKDGNNLNISEGAFYVYNNGVRTTEYITADMTVNDFMALLARNGLIADISEDGSISVGAYNNTYLATSATSGANSNIVSTLFAEWDFVNIYTSNGLTIPKDVIKAVTRDTKLSDINEGTYQEGFITVVKDGIQTNIELTADDTIGTLMDQLALYGFESVLNENGQLILKNTGNSLLQKYTGTGQASNALELLGIDLNNWIQTNTYESETLNVVTTTTIDSDVTRDTLLSKLGVTTGEYYIYNNGVKYTAYISTGETMGSFLDTLKSFGIETSLVSDGDSSILTIIGSGDSYITKSNSTTNASNVVEKLFGSNNHNTSYKYEGLEQTSTLVTTFTAATEDTLLSYFNKPWGSDTLKAEGSLAIIVNGENAKIEITENETFGSLIKKFEALGLEASMTSDGQLIIQSGFDTFTIDQANTDSSIMATIGLQYHQDLGGFAASSETTKATTTQIEEKTLSVANYAGYDTKMGLLNISDGTLSIYRNGEKATIQIKKDETFGDLRSRISSAFADVDLTFEDGYLKIFSKNPDDSIEVGATTDTSNFAAITGISSDGKTVSSARELYCVNSDSVIMNSGLFRRGDVTEGTFIVGDATFSISNTTTLAGLISQINSNDAANATAYWDSIDGKLVIKSRTTGSALINIEAGTSNFTDIMGYTNTTWAADGSVETTKMNVNVQDVGNNAKFSINGTYYTSNSNTITSDISRIKGLTINLKGLTEDSSVTLTVERDKETLANAVSDIVDSYNELMKNVDEAISKDGKLHDQSVLKLVRNQLRNMMTSSDAGTTVFRNLDAIGIKVENASANNISTDNITTLTFDKDKFIQAYEADEDALKALLIGSDSNTGIFTKVETLIESSLKAVTGYFATAEASYDREVKDIENKIEKQKKALDRYRAQLEAKFASMDILIANMQQQYSSFLTT
ncbi:MAG: flagellar filament capping protein FliD [Candidatus Gastranaerophilaceae bacterium]